MYRSSTASNPSPSPRSPHVTLIETSVLWAFSVVACGPRLDHVAPAWPPHAPVDVKAEIVATKISYPKHEAAAGPDGAQEATPQHPGPIPAFVPIRELMVDVPGVQAREGEVQGLYYLEVVLGEASIDDELPLIVVLHGRGDSPSIPAGPFEGLSVPVRIVLPRAPEPLGDGWTWLPVSVTEHKTKQLSMALFEMSKRLASAIRELQQRLPTSGMPIVTGFSQGGMLTYALAVLFPSVVGIALPLAGWLPPLLVPDQGWPELQYPPIRAMHGSEDTIIPIQFGRDSVETMTGLGADASLYEFEGAGHAMSALMDAIFHSWLESILHGQIPLQPDGPSFEVPVPQLDPAPEPASEAKLDP